MNEEKGCDCEGEKPQISCHDQQQQCQSSSSSSSFSSKRAKSCKGTLYYSSILKSKSKNPLCIGISHSLPKVPDNIMFEEGESKGRSLADFRHICAGYSVYVDNKGTHPTGGSTQTPRSELPLCVGLELLIDRKLTEHQAPTHAQTQAQAHTQEDRRGTVVSQPQPQKTTPGEEYMTKFARNAGLVASGVYKNMRKVGNYIKANIDDTLFKRPK